MKMADPARILLKTLNIKIIPLTIPLYDLQPYTLICFGMGHLFSGMSSFCVHTLHSLGDIENGTVPNRPQTKTDLHWLK